MKNVPEHIYLNIGSDDANDFNDLTEVTWCVDSTSDSDIKYTRTHTRKWHNLIKNPKDLPDTRRKVLIQIQDCNTNILNIGRYCAGNSNMLDEIPHWERDHVYGKIVAWIEAPEFKIK